MRERKHTEAIKLIQQNELQRFPFPSVDFDRKPVIRTVKDLTKIFCCPNLDLTDNRLPVERDVPHILISKLHSNSVIEFVNCELLAYERLTRVETSATIENPPSCSPTPVNNKESEDAESFGTKKNLTSLISNKPKA